MMVQGHSVFPRYLVQRLQFCLDPGLAPSILTAISFSSVELLRQSPVRWRPKMTSASPSTSIRGVGEVRAAEPIAGSKPTLEMEAKTFPTLMARGAAAVVAPETRADASAYFLARLIV